MLVTLEASERSIDDSQELFFQNCDPFVSALSKRSRGATGPGHLRDQYKNGMGGKGGTRQGGAGMRSILGGSQRLQRSTSRHVSILQEVETSPSTVAVVGAVCIAVVKVAQTDRSRPPLLRQQSHRVASDGNLMSSVNLGSDFAFGDFMISSLDDGEADDYNAVDDTEDVVLGDLLTENFVWGDMAVRARGVRTKRKSIANIIEDGEDLSGFSGRGSDGNGRRSSVSMTEDASDGVFSFSDFAVTLDGDDDLAEDEEMRNREKAKREKQKSKKDSEMFLFGDFAIDMSYDDDVDEQAIPPSKHSTNTESDTNSDTRQLQNSGSAALNPVQKPELSSPDTNYDRTVDRYFIKDAPPAEKTFMNCTSSIESYEMKYITGHSSRIKSIVLTTSAKFFVVTSISSTVVANYEVRSGKEIQRYIGHIDVITNAIISRDDKLLSTSSRDNTIIVWDFQTARQLYCFHHPKGVTGSTFSKNGHFIVTGCQDWQCRLYSVRRKLGFDAITTYREHTSIVTAVCFEPNGENVVSGGADTMIKVWNAATGATQGTLTGHRNAVMSVVFSPNGKYILSTDSQEFRLWGWDPEQMAASLVWCQQAAAGVTCSIACFAPGPLAFSHCIVLQNEKQQPGAPKPPATPPCRGQAQLHSPGMLQFFDYVSQTHDPLLTVTVRAPVHAVTRSRNLVLYGDSVGNIFSLCLNSSHDDMAKHCT